MKIKQLNDIKNRIIQEDPDLCSVNDGTILAVTPIGDVLSGLSFDRSGFDKNIFVIGYFFLPLYVPADDVTLSLGARIPEERGGTWWSIQEPSYVERAIECLRSCRAIEKVRCVRSPEDLVKWVREYPVPVVRGAFTHQEALAYSLVMCREFAAARHELDVLLRHDDLASGYDWQQQVLSNTRALLDDLRVDPDLAIRRLRDWRDQTYKKLDLPREL